MRVRRLHLIFAPLLLTACGDHSTPSSDALVQPAPSAVGPATTGNVATFLPYQPGATAITYNPAVVPVGAKATVTTNQSTAGVTVRLSVAGMIPRRAYGAHLHTMACSELPDAAGPHLQHSADPTKPSVDPDYANPGNEVWLDFTADALGAASVASVHTWRFDEGRPPRSLIIHEQLTRTGEGVAGTAGARVACLTLPSP